MAAGIYKITNISNNKFYIGSAVNIDKRFSEHKSRLNSGTHPNLHLQASYKKYGETSFVFSVLEYCNIFGLIELEQAYIDSLKPEYNKRLVANSNVGLRMRESSKQKIREANLGKKASMEARLKQSRNQMGIVHSFKKFYGKLVSPDGDIYTVIENLSRFGREHGIDRRRMSDLASGKLSYYKGWRIEWLGL